MNPTSAVTAMLQARSVALVGASPRPGSFGERMVIEARRSSARMHLVNPRYQDIDGIPCAPSLAALDEEIDLVLLGVPDAALLDELKAAAAVGARSAVIFGSANGRPLREAVIEIAGEAGMAVCGAGCMGFVNNATGLRALGYLEPDPLPAGGVSLVTHSGSAFSTVLRAGRGFGFTGGHFHQGWANNDQRKLVLNAILWTAKAKIPVDGVASTVTEDDMKANLDLKPGQGLPHARHHKKYRDQQPQLRVAETELGNEPGEQRRQQHVKEVRAAMGEAHQADGAGVLPKRHGAG